MNQPNKGENWCFFHGFSRLNHETVVGLCSSTIGIFSQEQPKKSQKQPKTSHPPELDAA
jgi:hypothetical protein